MNLRPLDVVLNALTLPLSVCLALAALGCSGSSDTDGDDENEGGAGSGASGGTSGSGGGGTGGVPPECEMPFMPTDPTALIDDIEDGNPLIATVAGRNGSWWVSDDMSAGTITPPGGAAPPPERILGGRCDESDFAMRITGQGFTAWGANLAAGFRYVDAAESIDASTFSGVMFWARIGETHTSPVRVQFQDSSTHPEGGVCNPTPGSTDECYNGWGVDVVPIGTSWALYKIPFSRMTQRDFGYRAESFDTTRLYGIEWGVMQGTVFDLWIDDLWFYE